MNCQNEKVPTWDEMIKQECATRREFDSRLLSDCPWIAAEGEVSIFFASSSKLLSAMGRYLVEKLAIEELAGEGAMVFSFRKEARDYLRDMVLSRTEIDFWPINRDVLSKEELESCKRRYEMARMEIGAARLRVVSAGGMTIEDMDEELRGLDFPNCQDVILIDDLLSCRCRNSDMSELTWSMVGNRLSQLAKESLSPVVVLSLIPPSYANHPHMVFSGMGALREYVGQAFVMKDAGRIDSERRPIRWIQMDAVAGRCVGDPVVMEYDWHAGRFCEDEELSRSEESDQIEAALSEAADEN